jgi:hypothetical protein
MRLSHRILASLPLLFLLTACSEAPKPAATKEPAKPAEPVSALTAIYKCYQQARGWAPEAAVLSAGSLDLTEVKSQAGKAGAWEVTFFSERTRTTRRYTYSVVEVPRSNLREGVFSSTPDNWTPGGQDRPFTIQMLKIDSTAAYETAMKKAADYAAKHPDLPVKFLLERTKRFADPAWRVYWGESVSASNYSIFVNATSGEYLQTAH